MQPRDARLKSSRGKKLRHVGQPRRNGGERQLQELLGVAEGGGQEAREELRRQDRVDMSAWVDKVAEGYQERRVRQEGREVESDGV